MWFIYLLGNKKLLLRRNDIKAIQTRKARKGYGIQVLQIYSKAGNTTLQSTKDNMEKMVHPLANHTVCLYFNWEREESNISSRIEQEETPRKLHSLGSSPLSTWPQS